MNKQETNIHEQEINKNTKQSLIWFTIFPLFLHFIRFANSIILARILTPEDFGIVGIATVLLYYSNSFTGFGFSKAIIQRKEVSQHHYNVYYSFNLAISISLYIIFNISSAEISHYFHEPALQPAIDTAALLFLISALLAVPMTEHKRKIKFKFLAIAEGVKVFISMSISLTLALHGFEFWSIIYAMIISNLIAMLMIRMSSSISPRIEFQIRYFKELLIFGAWDFLWGQITIISDNIDKIMIGRLLDITQLGYFEKAQGLAKMPFEQFSTRLGMVSFSTFSRIQNDPTQLNHYFSKIMTVNAFVCFPIFIGLAAVADNFTLVLFGEKWQAMIEPLRVLSLSFLVASIMAPLISINIAMGYIKQQTILRLVGLILFLISLATVIPYGILPTSYVILCFNLFLFIASLFLLKKHTEITFNKLFYILYPAILCSLILLFAVLSSTNYLFIENKAFNLLTGIIFGIITYGLCTVIIPFKQWAFIRDKLIIKLKKIT